MPPRMRQTPRPWLRENNRRKSGKERSNSGNCSQNPPSNWLRSKLHAAPKVNNPILCKCKGRGRDRVRGKHRDQDQVRGKDHKGMDQDKYRIKVKDRVKYRVRDRCSRRLRASARPISNINLHQRRYQAIMLAAMLVAHQTHRLNTSPKTLSPKLLP